MEKGQTTPFGTVTFINHEQCFIQFCIEGKYYHSMTDEELKRALENQTSSNIETQKLSRKAFNLAEFAFSKELDKPMDITE